MNPYETIPASAVDDYLEPVSRGIPPRDLTTGSRSDADSRNNIELSSPWTLTQHVNVRGSSTDEYMDMSGSQRMTHTYQNPREVGHKNPGFTPDPSAGGYQELGDAWNTGQRPKVYAKLSTK